VAKRVRAEIVTPDPVTDISESLASRNLYVDMEVVQPLPGADTGTLKVTVRDFENGEAVAAIVVFELQLHTDEFGSNPLGHAATYGVPTTGDVLYPIGSNAAVVKVKTDANGYLEIPVNDLNDESVWALSDRSSKSPVLNCVVSKQITFASAP